MSKFVKKRAKLLLQISMHGMKNVHIRIQQAPNVGGMDMWHKKQPKFFETPIEL